MKIDKVITIIKDVLGKKVTPEELKNIRAKIVLHILQEQKEKDKKAQAIFEESDKIIKETESFFKRQEEHLKNLSKGFTNFFK